jgi:hypothetical protein
MNANTPLVILGFGRSGTTWLADIVSKATGKILLFEPFHPVVCHFSQDLCYNSSFDPNKLKDHWLRLYNKQNHNRWLLRNHINSPLDEHSSEFIDYIWDHIQVGGFKSIRLNHNIDWVVNDIGAKPLYIIRHPLAVVASLFNRPRFWEEYGWDYHWLSFIDKTCLDANSRLDNKKEYLSLANSLLDTLEKASFMWGVSQILALKSLASFDLRPFFYEDMYQNPFEETSRVLSYLNITDRDIHPSYIFTPSMVTHRTMHGLNMRIKPSFFWENTFNNQQIDKIIKVLYSLTLMDTTLAHLCSDRDYFNQRTQ